MDGPRAPEEREYPQLLAFLNESLRPAQKWSIQEEYPTALTPSQRNNSRVLVENNRLVSHAILKPLIVRTPSLILKVGAIGSVVTRPEYRGKGLAKKTLLSVVDEAANQDCDIAILWTNLYDYYRAMKFELAGSEVSFTIDRDLRDLAAGTAIKEFTFLKSAQVDPNAILKLYNQHNVNSHRSAEDIRLFLKIPQSRVYTAWDKSGALAAYAIEGKGADLQDHVHEWAGGVTALMELFSFIWRDRQRPFTVMTPASTVNLISQLYKKAGNIHEGYLGMIRICRPDLLFPKIEKAAASVGLVGLKLERSGDSSHISYGNQEINFENDRELVSYLFGPHHDEQRLNSPLHVPLQRLFPLPIWVWGWDSV